MDGAYCMYEGEGKCMQGMLRKPEWKTQVQMGG